MNLHEYQGKELMRQYNVNVPRGIVIEDVSRARQSAEKLQKETGTTKWAVKAQIHAGGRGKGGGVKIAKTIDEVEQYANQILGMYLVTPQTSKDGKLVRKILIEENIYYEGEYKVEEFYMGLMLNREIGKNIILYSPKGGMDIEAVAEETPEYIFKETIESAIGLQAFQCKKIAKNLKLTGTANKNMITFVNSLYNAYLATDASLFEINPVMKAADNKIIATDAKVVIEENSLYRHPDIAAMRDEQEEDPTEVGAKKYGLNYIKLDGNVGCMVNGAGLAMATMDIIKLSGGEPANFLDVGGSSDAKRVENAFRIILQDVNVKAILVNIFGGIVRCDRVANGIVDAYKNIGNIEIPIIVRLQGTNAKEAKNIIDNSGLKVHSAIYLDEAAKLVSKLVIPNR